VGIDLLYIELNMNGYGTHGLRLAREQGLSTRMLCRRPDEYARLTPDPTRLADAVDRVDTYDVQQLLRHCVTLRPGGVIAYDDYRLLPAAVVAAQLGLPGPDPTGVLNCRYKDLTRKATAGLGRDVQYAVVALDAIVATSPVGYPCVVKPIDDSASAGVRVCRSDVEFQNAVRAAVDHDTHARGYRCVDAVLVEEYVAGPEYSAELLWDSGAGRWRLLGFVETLLSDPPTCKEIAHVFPARLDPDAARLAEKTIVDWLHATGHRGTAAHVEFKMSESGAPALMEINPRLGGGEIRLLLDWVLGLDVVDLYQRLWLGRPVDLPARPMTPDAVVLRYLTPPREGTVRRVAGPGGPHPGVIDAHLPAIGIEGVRSTTTSRLGWVATRHREHARAEAIAVDFHSRVVFDYQAAGVEPVA